MNKQEITRIRYTTDAVIDEILLNPAIAQQDLAKMFGYTQTSMSIIVNSDAFQERLAQRKAELTDPLIKASITDRLNAIARTSLDKIASRLDNPAAQIKTMELVAIAKLGVGDQNTRPAGPIQQNNLYVVALPPQARDSADWLASTQGNTPRGPLPLVQEVPRG